MADPLPFTPPADTEGAGKHIPPFSNGVDAPDDEKKLPGGNPISKPPIDDDMAALDEAEKELRTLRIDLPGGAATGAGLTAVTVAKTPGREEFFRTHEGYIIAMHLVTSSQGIDTSFLA